MSRVGSLRLWVWGLLPTLWRSSTFGGLSAVAPLASSDGVLSVSPLDAPVSGCFLPWAFPLLELSAHGASCSWMLLLWEDLAPGSSCFASRGGFHGAGLGISGRLGGALAHLGARWRWLPSSPGPSWLPAPRPGGAPRHSLTEWLLLWVSRREGIRGVEVALGLASCLPVPPPGRGASLGGLESWG